jgi:hypothetical protein
MPGTPPPGEWQAELAAGRALGQQEALALVLSPSPVSPAS